MTHWQRVKYLIKLRETTQEWVANQIPVSIRTFQGWILRDIWPDALQEVAIAKALGVTVEHLVTGKDEEISEELREIVHNLKRLTDDQREIVALQVRALAESGRSRESKTG